MIRYALRCREGHGFEAWFGDSAAFEAQRAAGLVECALCGVRDVEKALMAPAVRERSADARGRGGRGDDAGPPAEAARAPSSSHASPGHASSGHATSGPAMSGPTPPQIARALAELRAHVEKTADYVGPRFAEEARARHGEGEGARPVWGEASAEDAKALIEEGVPIAPLPHFPRRND